MARFLSRYASHRLIVRPPRRILDAEGRVVGFDIGKTVEFVNHVYETDDPEELEVLRKASEVMEVSPELRATPEPQVEITQSGTTDRVTHRRSGWRCDHCGKSFQDSRALAYHVSTEHGIPSEEATQ